jgi:hypothetical protein
MKQEKEVTVRDACIRLSACRHFANLITFERHRIRLYDKEYVNIRKGIGMLHNVLLSKS